MVVLYVVVVLFFFFKQKTAYEMRISDWSSDVCSSDLRGRPASHGHWKARRAIGSNGASPRTRHRAAQRRARRRGGRRHDRGRSAGPETPAPEIGRASWRERGCKYV